MIRPGEITIANTKCWLIEDFINAEPPQATMQIDQYQDSYITCSNEEYKRIRKLTDLPIYGIWQVLIANGILTNLSKGTTYALYYDDKQTKGQVIEITGTGAETGEIAFYAKTENLQQITTDINFMNLPKNQIFTYAQKSKERKKIRQQKVTQYSMSLAVTGLTFLFSNFYVDFGLQNRTEELNNLAEQNHQLETSIKSLLQADHTAQSYFSVLTPIAKLLQTGKEIKEIKIVFEEPPYFIKFPDRNYYPEIFQQKSIRVEHLISGATNVYFG